jgi:hypothetical protein
MKVESKKIKAADDAKTRAEGKPKAYSTHKV